MSLHPGGILSWRTAVLIALVASGYQFNRQVEIDGLDQLKFAVRNNGSAGDPSGYSLAGLFSASQPSPDAEDLAANLTTTWATLSSTELPAAEKPTGTQVLPASASRRSSNAAITPGDNLRIASWAVNGFGPQQLRDAKSQAIFVSVIRHFDIVALQQVRASERDFLPTLVSLLNRDGRAYDYLAGPIPTRNSQGSPGTIAADGEQLVFLFDTTRVVTDRTQLYTVADPDNRLTYKPLVAWFRAAQVDPQRAWTFSLVNLRVDLSRARQEVYEMPRLFSVIGADGRGEDDVVFAGLLQADHNYLKATLGGSHYWFAAQDKATDIYVRHQTSNLILDRRTTTEAILRGGVLDFLRANNLSVSEAEAISPHLPVYAEFCPWEGGN